MKIIRRQRIVVILLMVAFMSTALVLQGCGGLQGVQIPETPEGKYLAARTSLNLSATRLADYRDLQPADKQIIINEKAKPVLESARLVLDTWKLTLQSADRELAVGDEAKWAAISIRVLLLVNEFLPERDK